MISTTRTLHLMTNDQLFTPAVEPYTQTSMQLRTIYIHFHSHSTEQQYLKHGSVKKWIDFEMDGYELWYNNRQNKGDGGVVIYIDKSLNSEDLDGMTTVVNYLLECLTIEKMNKKEKSEKVSH